jgi:hypothetical protein
MQTTPNKEVRRYEELTDFLSYYELHYYYSVEQFKQKFEIKFSTITNSVTSNTTLVQSWSPKCPSARMLYSYLLLKLCCPHLVLTLRA